MEAHTQTQQRQHQQQHKATMKKSSSRNSESSSTHMDSPHSPLRFHSPLRSELGDPPESPPYKSPENSPEKQPDCSKALVVVDRSTQYSPLPSPWGPHKPPENANKNSNAQAANSPSPVLVFSRAMREEPPPSVTKVGPSGGEDGRRSGTVASILRRTKREEIVKRAALGFRVSEFVFCLISFSVMAADKTQGWSGDSFDRYKEYRYCLSVNVIAFVYSGFQAYDLAYHLATGKHVIRHYLSTMATTTAIRLLLVPIRCSDSTPRRGFGAKKNTDKVPTKSTTKRSGPQPTKAPGLNSQFDGEFKNNYLDLQFEERLESVRRSVLEQKKTDAEKEFGAIDYDAPVESEKKTIGLGTQIGVGVAVVVFGLVFALGDFLPSGSVNSTQEGKVVSNKLSEEEKATLEARLKDFEAVLSRSPKDPDALEGAAVTLAELGKYTQASSLLEDLTKEKQSDPDVFRLLGEVKYELKDYEGSAAAYRTSQMVSKEVNFEVLRGLTNALLAAQKPDEAVKYLLASREHLSSQNSDGKTEETKFQQVDPVQVELLLGKAYSDWGHISDAVSVYDLLISSHPNDFRGYLAKGIVLKQNGKVGDAGRMFIQARFFAPEKAKVLVDRYSR